MIPISDSVRSRRFPYVNVAIIAINVLVFLYELTLGGVPLRPFGLSELDRFLFTWGTIPACLSDQFGFQTSVSAGDLTIVCNVNNGVAAVFYSMFIHGGWLHLLGNMVFLWVFGDNVEDAMGHVRYAFFYLTVGLVATAAQVWANQNDLTPAIGASGAIAGVLGAYLVLYPRATVTAILPFFLLVWIPFHVPAVLLIGLWFVLQLLNGITALTSTDIVNAGGGIAWFAHIGGFLAGVVLVKLFVFGRPLRPARHSIGRRGERRVS
jgi:membrane associated rhomboid family serine protease